jgi:hypothetical protein
MIALPPFYFDLRNREGLFVDEEGTTLQNVDAAQEEATQSLAHAARDAIRSTGELVENMAIEVRDDIGVVMKVKFKFEVERTN